MKILVTAFEPFGTSGRNSSLETMQSLPDTTPAGHSIVRSRLPVVYDECGKALADAVTLHSPHAVVCLGQAEGRGNITPEYIAVNVKHSTSADNSGTGYTLTPIDENGPDGIITTIPVRRMTESMKACGIPSSISFTAGTYVCNTLMYHAIRLCSPAGIPAGFIHLPLSCEIALAESKAGRVLALPQEVLTRGILTALDCL